MQYLHGLADWLPPQAGMFMWLKLGAGVKDADDIIDTLREEKVGVVPGMPLPVLHGISLELLALRQDLASDVTDVRCVCLETVAYCSSLHVSAIRVRC